MNVNSEIWGSPQTNFDTINQRTGAVDLNDPDYENFPPFVTCDLSFGESTPPLLSTQSLWVGALIKPQYFYFQAPIDKSIAYCACKNPEIFTAQYAVPFYGLYDEPYADMQSPREAFKLISDDTPTPYIFMSAYPYSNNGTNAITTTTTQLYNPYYPSVQVAHTTSLYYPRGTNSAEYDTKTHINNANKNLLVSYWRDFGLRSLFGVIRVAYIDNTYNANTGLPTAPTTSITLKAYEDNTEEWKSTHNIVAAWLSIYFRRNIDGTYSPSRPVGQFFGVDCSFHAKASGFDGGEIWQPIMNYYKNANSYLPLFGHTGAGVGTTTNVQYQATISTNASGGTNTTSYMLCGMGSQLEYVKHGKQEDTSSTEGIRTWWCELPYTETEKLRKAAASYGLFFADDVYDLADAGRDEDRWTDVNMCLGVVDDSGYTDGTYTRGEGNTGANNFNWKTASESKYDPSRPPPSQPMTYDDVTTFNDITNIATLTRRYALTKQNVEDLGSELWQISSDIINNIQNDEWYKYTADVMDTFLVTDPLSCIVSLQKYPLTIPEQSGPVLIKLGKAETSISANITKATAKTYYFTPVPIRPRFGNSYMDYEPYTHFELYVPFCGTTELDPRDILGRTLSVNLVVDFNTGTCVAYVLSDSLVIETINGSLAIDIPVTGVDSTTIASNITQGIINTRNARYTHQFGTLGKVASPSGLISNIGNVWGSAQTILTSENNAKLSEYELTHQPAQPHVIGSASPVGSWAIDFKCRLLIYYPTGGIVDESKVADSSQPTAFDSTVFEQYQTQIGFATVDPVSALGASYAHTLVCAEKAILNNVTTPNGRPATEPELQLIRQALQEGVILP